MCDFIQQIHPQASRGFTPRSYGSYPVARSTRINNVPPAAAKGRINVNVSRSHFAFVRNVVSLCRRGENHRPPPTPRLRGENPSSSSSSVSSVASCESVVVRRPSVLVSPRDILSATPPRYAQWKIERSVYPSPRFPITSQANTRFAHGRNHCARTKISAAHLRQLTSE